MFGHVYAMFGLLSRGLMDYCVYVCELVFKTCVLDYCVYICMQVLKYKLCSGGFPSREGARTWFIFKNNKKKKNVGQADVLETTPAKYVGEPTYLKPHGNASGWPGGHLRTSVLMVDVLNATWLAHRVSIGCHVVRS
jgi:hypothetical protein